MAHPFGVRVDVAVHGPLQVVAIEAADGQSQSEEDDMDDGEEDVALGHAGETHGDCAGR